ncbi:MAG: hypothetical protein LBU39_09260 [Desulfobulbaceae bacterium]|jgi:hypothetical protein|nr:hypothetical protein [Desulfobulbaceae bacterium]
MKTIVSLTSFPARIDIVAAVVKTMLAQTVSADKVVLYLTLSQFPDKRIPEALSVLRRENQRFEVRFYEKDIRSFTKLIPALDEFPDDRIITVDDDTIYPHDLIENLMRTPEQSATNRVCARRVRYIKGDIYKKWHSIRGWMKPFCRAASFRYLPTGVGGVLYPPHCLHEDVARDDIFMRICPTADDLWFWAMATLNGVKIAVAGGDTATPSYSGSQRESLAAINCGVNNANNEAFAHILRAYPELLKFIR